MRHKEFMRLYSEHARSLYAFLNYRTGDRVLAEDLLADTFEHVLRARHGFDRRKASERTWLYTIAMNCVRDNARRAAAETRALTRIGGEGRGTLQDTTIFDDLEIKELLKQALGTLSDQEREVVALRFGADLGLAEIAKIIDEPRSKVEARIYRGLRKLRNRLDPQLNGAAGSR